MFFCSNQQIKTHIFRKLNSLGSFRSKRLFFQLKTILIMSFVKEYNERTSSQQGNIIPVELSVYEDRSFSFITKTSPATALLKKAAGISKGSSEPNRDKVGKVSKDKVREIAEIKMPDLNAADIEGAIKIVSGTARSMGIEIV